MEIEVWEKPIRFYHFNDGTNEKASNNNVPIAAVSMVVIELWNDNIDDDVVTNFNDKGYKDNNNEANQLSINDNKDGFN